MEKKHQVHNLIILDESGSMSSVKKVTIDGFNELVQTAKGIEQQFTDQQHFITLISFNGMGNKIIHFLDPVDKLQEINSQVYNPNASTPLYDAMGFGITKLEQFLQDKTEFNVLVTVFTDGEENASREYSGKTIKAMIEKLQMHNWTFTYIGTDHDVEKFAESLSIRNVMHFNKSEAGINEYFTREKEARIAYSRKISRREETNGDFYKPETSE
jgi:Mg-chelatase subunit ChlD